ncbi:MAG: geranylgeranylglycerol-phosphate geranylgeranyltransferase [Flavobacteriaceae bacterium]|jgi:4-hydroxybenzoate polyprenyltransferase|nr:geranylgeranylglycerol-phosphate geranylgeranyltransferase [Flavobacteriaceae bacterium]
MLFKKQHINNFGIQILALFASVRGYTLITIIVAQYLSARYIFAPNSNWRHILFDSKLLMLVLATSAAIAGGYLINNFYDAEKDQINRPHKYLLEHRVPASFQLFCYSVLNALTLILSALVSMRTLPFFLAYIFGIWLYSHLLKKHFWASNVFAVVLAVIPFFAITLYFKNFSSLVFYHASFLFLIVLIRDLIKDLENFKGDWVRGYKTIAVVFGERTTKILLSFLVLLTFIPIALLLDQKEVLNSMWYYFVITIPFLLLIALILWRSPAQKTYLWLHNLLKALIVAGILSIVLVRFPL